MPRPQHDGCEWSPSKGKSAYDNDPHWLDLEVKAEWIVGAGGKWRLCAECAQRPEFKRYRKRVRITETNKPAQAAGGE